MDILLSIEGASSQGILWATLALGVYISYRILDCADLTVEGSFAMGGAISAICITNGFGLVISILLSIIGGATAGLVTGLLNTKLKIPSILSGILCMIGLYSINIRIMSRSNIPLIGEKTLFTQASSLLGISLQSTALIVGFIITVIIVLTLYMFFKTEIGATVIATGNNENMVRAQGVNTDFTKVLALMVSNALVGLSGSLVSQSQGYADVGMGVGAIVIGLASVVIGEVIFGKKRGLLFKLSSIVVGSVVYRIIIALALRLGLNSNDLKLVTAIIIAFALALPLLKEKLHVKINKHNQEI